MSKARELPCYGNSLYIERMKAFARAHPEKTKNWVFSGPGGEGVVDAWGNKIERESEIVSFEWDSMKKEGGNDGT